MKQEHKLTLQWLTGFLILVALFYWVHRSSWFQAFVVEPLSVFYAMLTTRGLAYFGLALERSGTTLLTQSGTVEIAGSCSGSFVFMIFAAAVLPFPAPLKSRLTGVVLGASGLFFLNLLRISLIVLIVARFPNAFWSLHIIMGQVLVISGMFVLFLWWMRKAEGGEAFFRLTQNRKQILRAAVLFTTGYLAFYWLYAKFLQSRPGGYIQEGIAQHATWLISVIGKVLAAGPLVHYAPRQVQMVEGCLSSPVLVFFTALVFAWPVAWWKRLLTIVLGFLPLFYVYHLLRAVLIAATLEFQAKGTNLTYNLYGQVILGSALLFLVALFWRRRTGLRITGRLVAGLCAGLFAAICTGSAARHLALPLVSDLFNITEMLSYDPQQSVSRMPDLQAFFWTALMTITPQVGPAKRTFFLVSGFAGVLLVFISAVALIGIFHLQPHVGLLQLSAIMLPFLIYAPFLTGKGGTRRTVDCCSG